MANRRLRVGFDANLLIAGVRLPRWPYEAMRAALSGAFDLCLPEDVVIEARRHIQDPRERSALEEFLDDSGYEELPSPRTEELDENADLIRDAKDVPIALALMRDEVDIFVTNDRDFTDETGTAERFRRRVKVMLTAVFLRDVLGWSSDDLERVRYRGWDDMPRSRA